jgi:hypothetical protein
MFPIALFEVFLAPGSKKPYCQANIAGEPAFTLA